MNSSIYVGEEWYDSVLCCWCFWEDSEESLGERIKSRTLVISNQRYQGYGR